MEKIQSLPLGSIPGKKEYMCLTIFLLLGPNGQAGEFGPSSQLNFIDGTCTGTINLYFEWNKADKGMHEFQVEIE